jgi:Cellulase (glycosyl hydrolase family 5)
VPGAGNRPTAYCVGVVFKRSRKFGMVALALVLAVLAVGWQASAGASIHTAVRARTSSAVARSASTVPLGGVNVAGLSFDSTLAEADQTIALARTLHAKVVRSDTPWSVLEPRAAGVLDPRALAFEDRLVQDAAASGIKVIVTIDSTPCWASSAPAVLLRGCTPTRQSPANAWAPSDPSTFAAVAAFLAGRYGTKLTALEVWNEPDQANQDYLAGPEKPQHYAALLRAAYPAIKQANPRVLVLGGSLVGSNGVFLRLLYAAGIKGYYDGLAVHFYTLALGSLRAIHETQMANGDSTPLWLDEFGWSSCWPHYRIQQEQPCVTPSLQGANLADIFRSLARTRYVAADVAYKLQGSTVEDFGVLNANGTRKPAFAPLAQVLTAPLRGKIAPVTLSLRSRRGRILASGSGPAGDYLGLEAFQGSMLRYRALFMLDRFNRYSIALPRVLGTHGLRVRVFQYWSRAGAQRSV